MLAQETVAVNVIYGAIIFSEDELGLEVGDAVTITVSCRLEGCESVNYRWEVYGDQILGLQWGDWHEDGLTRDLTITASDGGDADLQIWLEDSDTLLILDSASIPVSVE